MTLAADAVEPSSLLGRVTWFRALVALTMLAMFANMTLQAREIDRLEKAVRIWKHRAQWPAVGVTFPPMATTTLRGDSRMVGARSPKSQIIAVFTTTCPFCRASVPQWRRLSGLADTSATLGMTWLSLSPRDSTLAYANTNGLPEEHVAFGAERALVLAARMRGVPVTLVVDTGGVIQHEFVGQLTEVQADSVLLAARTPRVPTPTAMARSAKP